MLSCKIILFLVAVIYDSFDVNCEFNFQLRMDNNNEDALKQVGWL